MQRTKGRSCNSCPFICLPLNKEVSLISGETSFSLSGAVKVVMKSKRFLIRVSTLLLLLFSVSLNTCVELCFRTLQKIMHEEYALPSLQAPPV